MIINSNTPTSFSLLNSRIKVSQNSIQQIKNSESISLNINKNTLNTLDKLSSLEETTYIKAYDNSYIHPEKKAKNIVLEEHYKKTNEDNKKFSNSKEHIWNKYNNPKYEYYAKHMNTIEKEIAYIQETKYLDGKNLSHSLKDYVIKDMKSINAMVDQARKKEFDRDRVNDQFQKLLNRYGIEIPKDVNINFTIEPYNYKVSVSGLDDISLTHLIEDTLNTANNSKELFFHIYQSYAPYKNEQLNNENFDKQSVFHEVKKITSYDLRDLENTNGKFLTPEGIDVFVIYKQGILSDNSIPDEHKGLVIGFFGDKLSNLAKNGFDSVSDMILSIDYKNGSFYDIGQEENFGFKKRDWIDNLETSTTQTYKEIHKTDELSAIKDKEKRKADLFALKHNLEIEEFMKNDTKKYINNFDFLKSFLMKRYFLGKDDEFKYKIFELLEKFKEIKK
ncbi:DUF4885 family protein [Aliarcobacter lanthieri]|uniref:DUF4885 family protein n=1 Tax=Aliarcobacter lanthieri TaxID=1355374 RepID=UPI003AAB9FE4